MQKKLIIIAAVLLVALGPAYYVFSPSDDPSEEPEIEIELLSEPVVGESNTVQAQENGTALAGETLYVNGEAHGELNDAGITEFTAPDTEELTLEVSDTTKTITVNETDEIYEENEETELVLDSEPEVGEMNRLLLYINGERTRGETIYLNGEELGETSNTGTITFTIPNEEQITLSTGLEQVEDKTVTPEGYEDEKEEDDTEETNETEEETREGLKLRHQPVAEEWNTVTLYENDETVGGETIYLDGDDIGETDELGEISFEVPNTEEITINTDLDGIDSITEQVDGYDPGPELQFIMESVTIANQEPLTLEKDEEPFPDQEIFLNGQSIGETDENGQLNIEVPARDKIELTVNPGDVSEETEKFQTEKPDIDIVSISPEEETKDHQATLSYDIETDVEHTPENELFFENEITLNGETVYTNSEAGREMEIETWEWGLEPTTHNWDINLNIKNTRFEIEENNIEFTTDEEPPLAYFELVTPTEGTKYQTGEITYEYDIFSVADIDNYEIILDPEGEDEEVMRTGNEGITSEEEYNNYFDHDTYIGDYQWHVMVEAESGENLESERENIEVGSP